MSDWSRNMKSEAHFHITAPVTTAGTCGIFSYKIHTPVWSGSSSSTHTGIQSRSMMVKDQILLIWDGKQMYMHTSGGTPANILVWLRAMLGSGFARDFPAEATSRVVCLVTRPSHALCTDLLMRKKSRVYPQI